MNSHHRGRAIAMLLTGFTTQNLAMGTTFGAYGLIVATLTREFQTSNSLVALGMGMVALCVGLAAPVVGALLDRWSVRSVMLLGALTAAVGFITAAQAQSIAVFLFCFGLLVGLGITFIGPLPSAKLAGSWFPQAPGKAIGFIGIALLMAIGPPLYSRWIEAHGWRSLFTLLGVVFLLTLPLLWFVKEPPGGASSGVQDDARATTHSSPGGFATGRVWQIGVLGGLLFAGGVTQSTHIVNHALRQGIDSGDAALLMAVLGIAASAGSLLWGGAADRFGPAQALRGLAVAQAVLWAIEAHLSGFAALATLVAIMAICSGGVLAALCALVMKMYGQEHFGTALGRVMLIVTPFNFMAAPVAGMLFDATGSYTLAFYLMSALNGIALVLLLAPGASFRPDSAST